MHTAHFEYLRPANLREALSLYQQLGAEARFLAGGHSLIPSMKLRLAQPSHLIDLSDIDELRVISADEERLWIGAMATHREVESSELVVGCVPVLSHLAGGIADPQVRNRGTIGGSLATADPAADYPAAALALDARIEVAGENGRRLVAADDWGTGLMATALEPGEMITRVAFPVMRRGQGSAYVKVPHPASRFAVVGILAVVGLDEVRRCASCRLAITGVGECAQRALEAEALLVGSAGDASSIDSAAGRLGIEINFMDDGLLTEAGKRQLCRMTARSVIAKAFSAAQSAR